MFNKVLVLSASVGAGHVRAGQALEQAFEQTRAASQVRHIDTLDFTNKAFRRVYAKSYIDMVNTMPEVLGWLYDRLDKPFANDRMRLAFSKLNTRRFVKMLEQERPDIAVCTHFLPEEIIAWLKREGRLTCPLAVVVTDFDVHAMWLCRPVDHFFVALEETRVHMGELGVAPERISVTGIPIDPVFAVTKDKHEMRRRHGLEADRATILLSAGGFGVGPIENLLTALGKMRHRAQVIAVCGRNEELKARLEAMAGQTPAEAAVRIRPIGYTTEMDEYMAASDVLLGKPGGLTTSEALAKGLVFVIVNPIPGQEERNSDHLLEEGVAIRCNNLPVLAYKIDRLLDDPGRFAAMQARAKAVGRPDAARQIVRRSVELQEAGRLA
jgi:processive 1,2-diacylglycerol beta-glucosyltransferase